MVKKILTISMVMLFSLSAFAQERALLHIGMDGKQEAIPLKKGEKASDVIQRLENAKASMVSLSKNSSAGLIDTIRYFTGGDAGLGVAFTFGHQDVALQYYLPAAGGVVKEFWWRNYTTTGNLHKATVRAWNVDAKVLGIGASKPMGHYKDLTDGDGLKTPYKPATGDQKFYYTGVSADSAKYGFDPLGTEASWLVGGVQFETKTNQWQGIKLFDWGDSMKFNLNQPFGFTVHNDTKLSDIVGGASDTGMVLLAATALSAPFHSIKFYETQRLAAGDGGWWTRIDYEWGMYVVVEYTSDRPPKFNSFDRLFTTLKTTPRTVKANVTDDNPGGGSAGVKSVDLYTKINSGSFVKSSTTASGSTYTGTIPGANANDTVTYYFVATDVNDLTTTTSEVKYTIFQVTKNILYMWNGRSLPTGITSAASMARYGMVKDSLTEPNAKYYDVWDVRSYGTDDIPALLTSYKGVIEATGDGGQADLTAMAGTWLATGTVANPKSWFFSDQDHGFISGFADTIFTDADAHAKYFGVKALINQDYPYTGTGTNVKTYQLDPVAPTDPIFGIINAKMAKDTVTYWYHPNFEWAPFVNWMDEFTPTASAKVLFKDKKLNTKVVGVRNSAADSSWHTAWLAFDYLSTDFRSDTSKHTAGGSPTDKYSWIILDGVENPAVRFLRLTKVLGVSQQIGTAIPSEFSLQQNYPNPFNPTTTLEYNVPVRGNVQITIYNVLGQNVATIVNESHEAGTHRTTWNGRDQFGKSVASGIYFYQMRAGSFEQVKKMMLMK